MARSEKKLGAMMKSYNSKQKTFICINTSSGQDQTKQIHIPHQVNIVIS